MKFFEHQPKYPLSFYVDKLLYIEGNNKGAGLPKINMSLVFNLHDNFKLFTNQDFTDFIDYQKYWIAGFQTKPAFVESYGSSKMVVIQFKTLGAFVFLNQPLHYFTDNYVPLDDVFQNEAEETWSKLQEAQTLNEKILLTENFLYRKLLADKMPNERLLAEIDKVFQENNYTSISTICQQFNISRKHLNFLFKESIGVSPKTLSSLYRFQNILKTISKAKPEKLTDFAYELEYFDQAHFNNDFKRFAGLNPTEYVKLVETTPSLKLVPHFLPSV